jgi:DNA helicase-2/ATP-dependent DNA helicase PcrA
MQLTDEQQLVADSHDHNMLVIAAAGSGKTRVITQRFVNLIQKRGVTPSRILCITFTNKAGNEMRQRVADASSIDPSELSIFTFHGFCNYWLRTKCHEIGQPPYSIVDADIANNAMKSQCDRYVAFERDYKSYIMMKHGDPDDLLHDYLAKENASKKKFKVQMCNKVKSHMANTMQTDIAAAATECRLGHFKNFIEEVLTGYEDFKTAHNYLDFDDLQTKGIELFGVHPMSQYYDYVMIDEIQDSSVVDLELLLSLGINNTMAVGDPRQSIYGFRGASEGNIEDFKLHFRAKEYNLSKNFRSDKAIISVSNEVVKNEGYKDMVANSEETGTVVLSNFEDEYEELDYISDTIRNFVK